MGAPLEHFPDQTGFFIGLNVFKPVQDLPHDLQVLRALADGAPALKECDCARLAQRAPSWMAMDMRLMLDRFCLDGMAATSADVSKTTELLGRRPRSYADFAAEMKAQWEA